MRVAAVVQALVLIVAGAIVAARAGVFLPGWSAAARKLIWLVVGLSVVSVVLNAITPSTWERAIWLPVTLVLLACAVAVARGPGSRPLF
jgi:cell division protein FtsW (lipid II flippase)